MIKVHLIAASYQAILSAEYFICMVTYLRDQIELVQWNKLNGNHHCIATEKREFSDLIMDGAWNEG